MLNYDAAYAVLHDPNFDVKGFTGRDDFSDGEVVDLIRRNAPEVLKHNAKLCRYLMEDKSLWVRIAETIPLDFDYRKFVDHFMIMIATSRHYDDANAAFRVLKSRLEAQTGAPYMLQWSEELTEDQITAMYEKGTGKFIPENKAGGAAQT